MPCLSCRFAELMMRVCGTDEQLERIVLVTIPPPPERPMRKSGLQSSVLYGSIHDCRVNTEEHFAMER